jgi:hypothetical protein
MRKWNIALALAPLAVGLCLTTARAHAEHGRHACRDDVQKLCPDVQPGGGHYLDCLQQHAADLSPACTDKVQRKQAALDRLRQICEPDVAKLCGDLQPGDHAIFACLRQHRDQVSQDCKDQIALARYRWHHHHGKGSPETPPADAPNGSAS